MTRDFDITNPIFLGKGSLYYCFRVIRALPR
jgi:hypothetical protein